MMAWPPRRAMVECLLMGLRTADDFEGVVGAAVGQAHTAFHRVLLAGVDEVGGAELAGHLELPIQQIDRDDGIRASQRCPLDHVETYATDAYDGKRCSPPPPSPCSGRRPRRGYRAPHDAQLVQRRISRTFTTPFSETSMCSAKDDTER